MELLVTPLALFSTVIDICKQFPLCVFYGYYLLGSSPVVRKTPSLPLQPLFHNIIYKYLPSKNLGIGAQHHKTLFFKNRACRNTGFCIKTR